MSVIECRQWSHWIAACILAVFVLPVGLGAEEGEEPGQKAYKGYRCPFDPHALTSAEVGSRLAAPLSPLEKDICASWCLEEADQEKRMAGLRILISEESPVEAALRDLVATEHSAEVAALPPEALKKEIAGRLLPQLRSKNFEARITAASFLALLGRREAVPAISGLISDPEINVRHAAVAALSELRDPAGLDALIQVARGPDRFLGAEAIHGVAEIGGPRARDALISIMDSWRLHGNVRLAAASALRRSGDPVAVAAGDRYLASLRPQWHRAFYFAALLYYLAFMASRPGSDKWWGRAFYAVAVGSILFLINPIWIIVGKEKEVFLGLAIMYPVGLVLGVRPIAGFLKRRGHVEAARGMRKRIERAFLAMWGTLALFVAVVFALIVIGLFMAWR